MQSPNVLAVLIASTILLCFRCNFVESTNSSIRIVGGRPTSISRVPYLVNLRINGVFACGGTLVSRRFVVTAAHCTAGVSRRRLTVVGGASRLSRRGVRRRVSRIFVPSAFRMSTLNKDLAVLKLSRPIRGRNIRPIRLCNRKWRPGRRVKVSGWGLTSESASRVPDRVRTVNVPIISKKTCRRRYQGVARLSSSMFCASVPGRRDSCSGDSGGPLIYGGRLCGVVSWGVGCARNNYPGVYTNIRGLRRFIRRAMRK